MNNLLKYLSSSSLIKNTGIYTFGSLINAAVPFLLLPILTRSLSTTDYGQIAVFTVFTSLLGCFIGVNGNSFLGRRYFDINSNDLKHYFSNIIFLLIFSSVLLFIFITIFSNFLISTTKLPLNWLYLSILYSNNQFIILLLLAYLQVSKKAINYIIIQITQTVLNVTLTLLFVIILKYNWEGRLLSMVLTSVCFSALVVFILLKRNLLIFELNKEIIFKALKYGAPIIPHTLGGIIIGMSDRIFLSNLVGLSETGIYSISFQVASVISILTTSFNNAFSPWLFERLSRDDSLITKRKVVRFTYSYFLILLLVVIIFFFLLKFLLPFFIDKKFHNAGNYIFWLLIGFYFQGCYMMMPNYFLFSNKTMYLAISTLGIGVLGMFLNFVLITFLGTKGATLSFAFSWFSFFVITWIVSAKIYKMPWKLIVK